MFTEKKSGIIHNTNRKHSEIINVMPLQGGPQIHRGFFLEAFKIYFFIIGIRKYGGKIK